MTMHGAKNMAFNGDVIREMNDGQMSQHRVPDNLGAHEKYTQLCRKGALPYVADSRVRDLPMTSSGKAPGIIPEIGDVRQ